MLSVIIPTFNESLNINTLIPHLRDCNHGEKLEIIIADSPYSSDNILEITSALGVKGIRCKKGGRAFQMNEGASLATEKLYYFLHADARPPKTFVDEIYSKVEEGCSFGIFSYRFDSPSRLLKLNAYFTKYDGLFSGGGDQSLFIKNSLFQELEGFDEERRIMEDFDLYRKAKRSGSKFCIIDNPLLVSARKYEKNSWLKVNLVNLRIFMLYIFNGSQETMIRLNKLLSE